MTITQLVYTTKKIALKALTAQDDRNLIQQVFEDIYNMQLGLSIYLANYPEDVKENIETEEGKQIVQEKLRIIGSGWREAKFCVEKLSQKLPQCGCKKCETIFLCDHNKNESHYLSLCGACA